MVHHPLDREQDNDLLHLETCFDIPKIRKLSILLLWLCQIYDTMEDSIYDA